MTKIKKIKFVNNFTSCCIFRCIHVKSFCFSLKKCSFVMYNKDNTYSFHANIYSYLILLCLHTTNLEIKTNKRFTWQRGQSIKLVAVLPT